MMDTVANERLDRTAERAPQEPRKAPRWWSTWEAVVMVSLAVFGQVAAAEGTPPVALNYAGVYRAGARGGAVEVQLVERLQSGGYISWTTVDGVAYLGNTTFNGNAMTVTWFHPSGTYQTPLGTIQGTLNADGSRLTGSFRQGLRLGSCTLTAR